MKHAFVVCCAAAWCAAAAGAEPPAVRPTALALHPAAPARPALQYALLPELRDQSPDDAAPHYKRAKEALAAATDLPFDWRDQVQNWLDLPLKDLPREKMRDLFGKAEPGLKEIEAAALCERCDWGHTERLRKFGISASIGEIQDLRDFARLLAGRARLETAEGKLDKAVRTIRLGFALARHAEKSPTFISALVGVALGTLMANRVEELVQQPDAPNLYWALTDLPRPFISLRKAAEGERVGIYGTFPGFYEASADPDAGPLPAEMIPPLVQQLTLLEFPNKELLAVAMLSRHETAKRVLIQSGLPKEKVESMPHVQVALLHGFVQYNRILDEYVKWMDAPYSEARPGIEQAMKFRDKEFTAADAPALPLARFFLPGVDRVMIAQVRLDRRLAALRCVEAIRLYAAAHDGRLPGALIEMKEVPIPRDPATGKDFDYGTTGDAATLSAPLIAGAPPGPQNMLSYSISVKP
jgi:hypothetical protein